MNVLKTPSFFRPGSRPASPAPVSTLPLRSETPAPGFDKAARSLNKRTLSNFRRPSTATAVESARSSPTPLVQDGSYLEMLSLKFSGAVIKALAQPSGPAPPHELVSGKRPLPQGRGHALGALIASELLARQNNPHLYRAILRTLHRPLSVLVTNLSGHLLPLLASPLFHSPPTAQNWTPNPTQSHALAVATFAQELLDTFDELGLGLDADARGDGLKSIREGLVSIILRIVSPLVADIRAELTPVIKALEGVNDSQTKATAGAKTSTVHHPSIVTLRTVMPVYTKALARYTAFSTAHAVLAAFLVGMVWKGLVALSNRPFIPSAPPSPVLASNKKVRTPPPYSTPPLTPQLGRFTLKLPPSRPPSPPIPAVPASASADAQALFEQLNLLPRPSADKEATRLAREAVDEAFDALKALSVLLDAIHKTGEGRTPEDMAKEIHELAKGIPLLVALPVLLHAYGGLNSSSVAKLLDLSGTEYRRSCLSGIGRAEESAHVIAQSVMDALEAQGETNGIVYQWLLIESSTST